MVEITAAKQNIGKRRKRSEDSIRDLWDNIKHTNIHIMESQKEKREKRSKKIYQEIKVQVSEFFFCMKLHMTAMHDQMSITLFYKI